MNIKTVDYEEEVLNKLDEITEILKNKDEEKADTVYKIETSDKQDYYMAFHGSDFYYTLWDLDQSLRSKIKYNEKLTDEQIKVLQDLRDELGELMYEHGVDFEHIS